MLVLPGISAPLLAPPLHLRLASTFRVLGFGIVASDFKFGCWIRFRLWGLGPGPEDL